jgi:large subunit ribosomal protein L18
MARFTPREARQRRHLRIRRRVLGTPERPRLAVFRSLVHIYAQVIDDAAGRTLASASTLDPDVRGRLTGKNKTARADLVGRALGERAKAAGVTRVVFDRGGNLYHGRVKALAEGARAAGLDF